MNSRCLVAIALILMFAGIEQSAQAKHAQPQPVYKFIGPDVAGQNQSFTGVVVEQTDHGQVPVEGGQVSFSGIVVDVKDHGRVRIPALATLGANVLVPTLLGSPNRDQPITLEPYSVKVLKVPPNVIPRIYHASDIISPGQPFRVQGQALNELNAGALVKDSVSIPLTNGVGSTFERVYPQLDFAAIKNGTYRFTALNSIGAEVSAPNQVISPHLTMEGALVKKKGTLGKITVTSDTDTDVQIEGGEPEITLSRHSIELRANEPGIVPFVAKKVGEYQVVAFAVSHSKQDTAELIEQQLKDDEKNRSDLSAVPVGIPDVDKEQALLRRLRLARGDVDRAKEDITEEEKRAVDGLSPEDKKKYADAKKAWDDKHKEYKDAKDLHEKANQDLTKVKERYDEADQSGAPTTELKKELADAEEKSRAASVTEGERFDEGCSLLDEMRGILDRGMSKEARERIKAAKERYEDLGRNFDDLEREYRKTFGKAPQLN